MPSSYYLFDPQPSAYERVNGHPDYRTGDSAAGILFQYRAAPAPLDAEALEALRGVVRRHIKTFQGAYNPDRYEEIADRATAPDEVIEAATLMLEDYAAFCAVAHFDMERRAYEIRPQDFVKMNRPGPKAP